MQIGRYRVSLLNHGLFRLDGGAMFGSVPKPLWEKLTTPDERNRILMATNSLIMESEFSVPEGDEDVAPTGGTSLRKLMVDAGNGDKYNEKTREIFDFEDKPFRPVPGITDLLFTHLHFDHCGGLSHYEGGELRLSYPNAMHYVSRANLENARNPNVRERASYLPENIGPLESVSPHLLNTGDEVWPGLTVHEANGHTRGLLWIKLTDGKQTVAFPSDLCPTSAHLPTPFVMGYDICAEVAMKEKAAFVKQAVDEDWIVVFEHDPHVPAGKIGFDERGRPCIREVIDLNSAS